MRWRVLSAIVFATALTATLTLGQKPARNAAPKYDLANEAKIRGVVDDMKEFSCSVTGGMDTHLIVMMSENKTVLVHLAPPRFLKEYGVSFAKNDQIELLGSKAKIGEEESILARKIERGNQTFTFRDQGGNPLW